MNTVRSKSPANRVWVGAFPVLLFLVFCGCQSPRGGGGGGIVVDWNDPAVSMDEAPSQGSIPLSLAGLVNAAKRNNPELLDLREAMEVARAEAVTVTGLRNPELRVEYDEGERITERTWHAGVMGPEAVPVWSPLTSVSGRTVESDGARYTLRLYPPNPWLMKVQGGGARARFAAASADLQAAEWRVECEIGVMLSDIAGLQRELEIVRRQAALRNEYLGAVQSQVKQQQATALDELDADQRKMRAEDDIAGLEQTMQVRLAELSALVGVSVQESAGGGGEGVDKAPELISAEDASVLRRRLVEARAEVMAAYWRHQDALSMLKEVRVSRIPWFTYLQGSYAKSESRDQIDTAGRMALNENVTTFDSIVTADDNQDEVWSIEAAVEIPIFSFHGGATRVQRANVKRYALALRESLRQSQAQFDMAYRGWRTAVTRVDEVSGVIAARQAKADELARKIDEAGGLGPEARLKVDEMILQLRRTEVQAFKARDMAWWRFQGSAGVRIRVAE